MQVVRRGKFNTLVNRDGTPVTAELYKCVLVNDPHPARGDAASGKTYATLDLTFARGSGMGVLQNVSTRITKEAAPEFSPLRPDKTLVVKFPGGGGVRHETREGAADAPFAPVAGQAVDVVLRLGAFGSFGYCWLVSRIKPHDATEP